MKIKSVFSNNERIPQKYTCDGENINIPLEISDIPKNAKTIAIIVDDPDAMKIAGKVWVHWVVFNIPVLENKSELRIAEGEKNLGTEGITDSNSFNYTGPCPPSGSGTHRYFFRVYAIDNSLDLKKGATRQEVEKAMKAHVLGKGELVGLYSR